MINAIVCVRLSKQIGKIDYFECESGILNKGDIAIFKTVRGIEYGKILAIKGFDYLERNANLKGNIEILKLIRKANNNDIETINLLKKEEIRFQKICQKRIAIHKLKMHLIDTEIIFSRKKVIFYFVAEGRIDFRNLVKDLAEVLKIRIEFRQVGVRDQAKKLGGLGMCGRGLCCATFLNNFHSVSMRMAREQGMSLNPTKTTGVCGRLLCCLKYEDESICNN